MAISRRKFVKAASLLTLAMGAPVKAAEALGWSNKHLDPTNIPTGDTSTFLNMQSFSRCVGTTFSLRDSNSKANTLKLIEVHNWQPKRTLTTASECFSLIFLAADKTRLTQNTYAAEHHALGRFQLFVVPIRGNQNGRYYEAVFNRVH